jgi:DNA-binding IscR family transcriptional regulator
LQIVETLEGPVRITPEPNGSGKGLSTRTVWEELQEKLVAHLASISLEQLSKGLEVSPELAYSGISTAKWNN